MTPERTGYTRAWSSALESAKSVKESDRQKLEQYVRRVRRWIDEGKLDDPSIIRAVQGLEERLKLGLFDKRTEAEAERFALLIRDLRRRLEQ